VCRGTFSGVPPSLFKYTREHVKTVFFIILALF